MIYFFFCQDPKQHFQEYNLVLYEQFLLLQDKGEIVGELHGKIYNNLC